MKTFVCFLVLAVAAAHPKIQGETPSASFWTGTKLEGIVESLQTECTDQSNTLSCMKYKVLRFLDQVLSQDFFQGSDDSQMVAQGSGGTRASRSGSQEADLLYQLEDIFSGREIVSELPGGYFKGTTLTMSPRKLDEDEVTFKLKFSDDEREGKALQGEEGRKTKLKKIIVPVLVFVLLKAMTLVPLAIGVLGIKAWNALQLSFFSFVVSLALAVFQLCKKLASDHSTTQVAAHGPWDNYQAAHYAAARAFPDPETPEEAQRMAYGAQAPNKL